MPTYYVIETKQPNGGEWTDDLGPDASLNCFKTSDEAWLAIEDLRKLDNDGEHAWAGANYRVAIYAGPEDDERIQGYYT